MELENPVTTGCIAFDAEFRQNVPSGSTSNGPGSFDRRILGFITDKATSNYSAALICQNTSIGSGIGPNYQANGAYPTFITGKSTYAHLTPNEATDARETYNIRVIAMRDTADVPWQIRVYDKTEGYETGQAIMLTTLDCNQINGVSGWYTAQSSADSRYVRIANYSAEYVTAEDIPAINTAVVKNSEGKIITTLGDEVVKADGIVNVEVTANKTGGILYAAVYDNGWRLVSAQSTVVTSSEVVPFTFTDINPSITTHIKVFYWDNGFTPLSTRIDPLLKQ